MSSQKPFIDLTETKKRKIDKALDLFVMDKIKCLVTPECKWARHNTKNDGNCFFEVVARVFFNGSIRECRDVLAQTFQQNQSAIDEMFLTCGEGKDLYFPSDGESMCVLQNTNWWFRWLKSVVCKFILQELYLKDFNETLVKELSYNKMENIFGQRVTQKEDLKVYQDILQQFTVKKSNFNLSELNNKEFWSGEFVKWVKRDVPEEIVKGENIGLFWAESISIQLMANALGCFFLIYNNSLNDWSIICPATEIKELEKANVVFCYLSDKHYQTLVLQTSPETSVSSTSFKEFSTNENLVSLVENNPVFQEFLFKRFFGKEFNLTQFRENYAKELNSEFFHKYFETLLKTSMKGLVDDLHEFTGLTESKALQFILHNIDHQRYNSTKTKKDMTQYLVNLLYLKYD
jgi:hypothetical protein